MDDTGKADDLAALADANWWLGLVEESIAAGTAAYRAYRESDRPRLAASSAIGVAVNLLLRGDDERGSGWIARAARLLADQPENVEHGYLMYLLEVEAALDGVDPDAVIASARRVGGIGARHGDRTLVAAGILGEGRVLVRQGRVPEGMALLDEAMVAVLDGELAPEWAGNLYCHMMAACHELADLRRARRWTEATERWLATLPAAVLFTGICRVHRSALLQTAGAWDRAERAAARVCADLADIHCLSAAEGHYQVGEICRLRDRLGAAEQAFHRAHQLGRDPQPGLALLRLAQGRPDAAAASIRAALVAESGNQLVRARLCTAQVEIELAASDLARARQAAEELAQIAATYRSPGFEASAGQALGAVLLAEDEPAQALPILRAACRLWRELDAPYECARVRVLLASAYRALGDADGAELEMSAAARVFTELGALRDGQALAALRGVPALPGGLSDREAEVLTCLAAGRTNKQIAAELVISEKTVARHLSNIFAKLGLSTRTAAAAYAFEHGLMPAAHG